VYGAADKEEVKNIGEAEGTYMQKVQQALSDLGITINVVSVGSTPTAPIAAMNPSVSEIRPGNYVFFDQIQVSLGACSEADCALFVLATVIALPEPHRVVIDAGSKALNLDRGAHAVQKLSGFGRLIGKKGEIIRLSEEHGIIETAAAHDFKIGSPVLIIPNHACAVSNLYDTYHFIDAGGSWTKIPVDARGRSD
jgi:D-serine deaminase-like pyridoxal phosphate-dependent protein